MHPRSATRSKAAILLAISVIAVAALTLFPFRFVESWPDYAAGLAGLLRDPVDNESPVHALPAFAMLLLARVAWPRRNALRLAIALALGLLLLEAAQAGLARRHARIADIAAQWAGLAAALAVIRFSPWRPNARHAMAALAWATLLGWTVFVSFMGARAQTDHTLGPYDDAFQLAIGDEVGGGRAWRGTIHGVAILAANPDDAQARALSMTPIGPSGLAVRRDLGDAAIYDLATGAASIQGTVTAPDRGTIGEPLFGEQAVLNASGLDTDGGGPLVSRDTLWRLPSALADARAVTIEADITPAFGDQRGPARILTVSSGPSARHLMLGQEGADLIARVRTARTGDNASRLPVRFDDVLEAGRRTHLVVVSTGDRFTLYADGELLDERILGVGPGDWLGAHTDARDIIASVVLFLPIGLAAAAASPRHAWMLAFLAAASAVGTPTAVALALDRPIAPEALLMAPSLALLAAIVARRATDFFKQDADIADPSTQAHTA